jgi:DNA-binding CsgD family transcriptional regulator
MDDVIETMIVLYQNGDTGMFWPLFRAVLPSGDDDKSGYAAFEETMVTARNRTMVDHAAPILADGGAFVAVGALEQSETARTLRERIQKLTPQQIRVLHLIIRGLQNREIASELKLAESTVKAHVTEILRKLKLFSRNKAIIELGKIPLPVAEACTGAKAEKAP